MAVSPLKKFIFTPLMCSAAVFSVLSLPLAFFSHKLVTIQFQEEPIFHGQLRDIATPYLGLTSVLSIGSGIATVAVTGWQQSSRKSAQTEKQLSQLERNLQEKQELLETLKLSASHLEISGLRSFLQEQLKPDSTQVIDEEVKNIVPEVTQPEPVANTSNIQPIEPPIVAPLIITTQPSEAQPVTPSPLTVQATVSKFASAQSFLGYNQAKTAIKPSKKSVSPTSKDATELQHQLEEIMAQMNYLQKALQATQPMGKFEVQTLQHPNSTPLKAVKSLSLNPVAS